MKSRTKQILATLQVVSWIVFIGGCIKTGTLLFSLFISLFVKSIAVENLYQGPDLSALYAYGRGHFETLVSLTIFLTGLKTYIFYLLIQIFQKINFVNPFSAAIAKFISRISYVAVSIGILTILAEGYCSWLAKKGVAFPLKESYLGGAAEFLLLGGVIFMIAQVFARGLEIQTENELTV